MIPKLREMQDATVKQLIADLDKYDTDAGLHYSKWKKALPEMYKGKKTEKYLKTKRQLWDFMAFLPDGLEIDCETGQILGTPTKPHNFDFGDNGEIDTEHSVQYYIEAHNDYGTHRFIWNVEIIAGKIGWSTDAPYRLSKPDTTKEVKAARTTFRFEVGKSITPLSAQINGDLESKHNFVFPFLPKGLKGNPHTGEISGAPEQVYTLQQNEDVPIVVLYQGDPDGHDHNEHRCDPFHIIVFNIRPEFHGYTHAKETYSKGCEIPWNLPLISRSIGDGQFEVPQFHPTTGKPNALPDGLVCDKWHGKITGKPTQPTRIFFDHSSTVDFVKVAIQATFRDEQKDVQTVEIEIKVVDTPPLLLGYSDMHPRYMIFTPIPRNTPSCATTGGEAEMYTVKPRLPKGMELNVLTGEITGKVQFTRDFNMEDE